MEPLGRAAAALVEAGLAQANQLQEIREGKAREVLAAGDRLSQYPLPTVEEIADTVHGVTPWTLGPDRLREPGWFLDE
jgi:TPP-dependent pyruvate/acetoin dehydrogenase alpha subunit